MPPTDFPVSGAGAWVVCDDPRARITEEHGGQPLLHGLRNPYPEQKLFRVLRSDTDALMIELVLPPAGPQSGRAVDDPYGVGVSNSPSWAGLAPIRGPVRVEIWEGPID